MSAPSGAAEVTTVGITVASMRDAIVDLATPVPEIGARSYGVTVGNEKRSVSKPVTPASRPGKVLPA